MIEAEAEQAKCARAESARHGVIEFQPPDPDTVKLSLPLEINDFVNLEYR